jgi:predicted CXXCH cytochrome family protein
MKRLNPVGSLFGYFLTVLLFIGLGFSLWYNRGLAFSPGPVTAISKDGVSLQGFSSHAEFEKRCSYCHEPIKTDLASKCKECHENVNQQILIRQGIHSQIGTVNECVSCHADHRGRDFNPTQASYKLFDHSTTAFNLNWHQENYDATPMECNACHINDDYSVVPNQECLDCHSNHEITFAQAHTQDFGADCLSCHDGSDRMQNFDHDQTGYPLVGIHAQINCTKCHQTGNLNETPSNCMNCHTEPTIHQGMFEQTCDSCHTPDGWSPAIVDNRSFSHTETAFFSLNRHKLDY